MKTGMFLVAIGLSACGQIAGTTESAAIEAVRAQMLDPEGARVKILSINGQRDLVCGQVNGKNLMGAYTGNRPFVVEAGIASIYPGDQALVAIPENVDPIRLPGDQRKGLEAACEVAGAWARGCDGPMPSVPPAATLCAHMTPEQTLRDIEAMYPSARD